MPAVQRLSTRMTALVIAAVLALTLGVILVISSMSSWLGSPPPAPLPPASSSASAGAAPNTTGLSATATSSPSTSSTTAQTSGVTTTTPVASDVAAKPSEDVPSTDTSTVAESSRSVLAEPLRVYLPGGSLPLVDSVVSDAGVLEAPPVTQAGVWPAVESLEAGSAESHLISSHVNYGGVTGLFAQLSDLQAGQIIGTSDKAGVLTQWTVTSVYAVDKTSLPAGIFERGPNVLVLVTCGGKLDEAAASYLDNVVVEANRVA